MPRQLLGGYYSDTLLHCIRTQYKDKAIEVTKDLLHSLSFFDTNLAPRSLKIVESNPLYSILSVFHNYIQRGLPTHASVMVEDYLADTWGGIKLETSDTGAIEYVLDEPSLEFAKLLFASLCVVDPRVNTEPLENGQWTSWLGSDLEKRFLKEILLNVQGPHWLQLIEAQRSIQNILRYSCESGTHLKELYNQPIDDMGEQRVDFSVEAPCRIGGAYEGLVLEVDGSQHINDRAQFNLDQYRDKALQCLEDTKWATLRARSSEWHLIPAKLKFYRPFFENEYFKKIESNYKLPLYQSAEGMRALHLSLTPIAVARIQKVLLELVFNGSLDLDKEEWIIGIAERDIDCASIAMEDFKDLFNRFCLLSGESVSLPRIKLVIYNTVEFRSVRSEEVQKKDISEVKSFTGDVLIDISVLQRWGLSDALEPGNVGKVVMIRSTHSKKELREFISAPLIKYRPLFETKDDTSILHWELISNINYFIQSTFRKRSLRSGQLPIINKALQYESVIGLLPTGGGKSMTYQICALLQPGICVIIDPIKSLMQDQNAGLKRAGIDATVFINSSLKTFYERKWALDQVIKGRTLFGFISPERLQIASFRDAVSNMADINGQYFTYCVIDEAHCVSEWGHDFRTSYLRLGENSRRYCKTWKGQQEIALFGLTATASFDVLSDVKRELKIGDEHVISNLSSRRNELLYQVHLVKTGLQPGTTGFVASQAVGDAKVQLLQHLMDTLPNEIFNQSEKKLLPLGFHQDNFYMCDEKGKFHNAVLVFCPHKSGRSPMGVDYVRPRLTGDYQIGTFYGADQNTETTTETSEKFQDQYINNNINALIATKAFGMGIDKPNIRSTVHFNFPSSIESFVQEAGRAGRDRKRAICHVLYSDVPDVDNGVISSFHSNNFKGELHDYEMLVELLHEITYPAEKIYNDITKKVAEDLGEEVQIRLWTGGGGNRLYVNRTFGVGYGYIQLNNLSIHLEKVHASIGEELAKGVLNYIVDYTRNNCPSGNYYEWIGSEVAANSSAGIEKALSKAKIGERLPDIHIGFRNDKISKIKQLLIDHVAPEFTEFLVEKAANYCDSYSDFQTNLIKSFFKAVNRSISQLLPLQEKGLQAKLEQYFTQIRREEDTYKAVYRLSILGVVDDYEVDYSNRHITIKLIKKSDEEYLRHLEDYLARYLSSKRVDELIHSSQQEDKGSMIRNGAWTLVRYVYGFVAKKRARAIREMQSVCEVGVSSQDYDELERTITLYFTSKYTNEMLELTNEGTEFTLDLVKHYVEETAGISDNLEHLRGSCARILGDNPDNGGLLVLRAFSGLLLETRYSRRKLTVRSQFLVDKALDDLSSGLEQFELNGYSVLEVLQYVRKELLLQNPGLEPLIADVSMLLSVRQHTKWLKGFNEKYIAKQKKPAYEHA